LVGKARKGGTCHWLQRNSIPKIGYHYFWPGLIALPKNTLKTLYPKGQEPPNTDYLEQLGHTMIMNDVEERVHSILP
jgi:hypothetical protein